MDASERLSVQLLVGELLTAPATRTGADLLVSALAAALASHRRATLCHPFPHDAAAAAAGAGPSSDGGGGDSSSDGGGGRRSGGGPDRSAHTALSALLHTLPPLAQIADRHSERAEKLPDAAWRLLHWLLLHPRHGRSLAAVPVQQVAERLRADGAPARLVRSLQQASCALQVLRGPPQAATAADAPGSCSEQRAAAGSSGGGGRRLWAFHGTYCDALHSILQQGLLNMTGLSLQRTGERWALAAGP